MIWSCLVSVHLTSRTTTSWAFECTKSPAFTTEHSTPCLSLLSPKSWMRMRVFTISPESQGWVNYSPWILCSWSCRAYLLNAFLCWLNVYIDRQPTRSSLSTFSGCGIQICQEDPLNLTESWRKDFWILPATRYWLVQFLQNVASSRSIQFHCQGLP